MHHWASLPLETWIRRLTHGCHFDLSVRDLFHFNLQSESDVYIPVDFVVIPSLLHSDSLPITSTSDLLCNLGLKFDIFLIFIGLFLIAFSSISNHFADVHHLLIYMDVVVISSSLILTQL